MFHGLLVSLGEPYIYQNLGDFTIMRDLLGVFKLKGMIILC